MRIIYTNAYLYNVYLLNVIFHKNRKYVFKLCDSKITHLNQKLLICVTCHYRRGFVIRGLFNNEGRGLKTKV